MKKRGIAIGMVALASLFTPNVVQQVQAIDNTTSSAPKATDATKPVKDTNENQTQLRRIGGLGLGEGVYLQQFSTSPYWHGKSQRKKHTSAISIKRRVNKRHKQRA